ncbi:MAG: response regulator [Acidobacteria bacterium]|nr:response regulator [Acidobacteriota bacterium]
MSPLDIWVVEDNDQNFDLVDYLLGEAGHRVVRSRDGDELAALVDSGAAAPDVVLLDINLPTGSGLDLVPRLRETPGGDAVPIVVVTAHAMRGDRERFLAAGCAGYISKPIETARFVAEVERYATGART